MYINEGCKSFVKGSRLAVFVDTQEKTEENIIEI
jgi:hypothetical protein